MSLLERIYEWSVAQKPFLRDALRRLLDSPSLTDTDYDDLFALLKLDRGIPDPENRLPQPLEREHLPSVTTEGKSVRLLSIKNLQNVNRIAANQKISFDPAGLTVIYGDNGTGKSGYSRVLKLACRARGEKAEVLPNANLPKHEQGIPEAVIVFELNGSKTKFEWKGDAKEHPELASLSVFDSHCARAYLDAEQDVAYLPYGLDIVENLANVVIPELNKRLKAAIASSTVDTSHFRELAGETKVGRMIASLSDTTEPALVETLSSLTKDEELRHEELMTALSEQDPKAKATILRRLAERLLRVKEKVLEALQSVDADSCKDLQKLITDTNIAISAEAQAIELFHSSENLLPSTGCEEWHALFEAAREFAALAYQGKEFPDDNDGTKCPLCQQQLQDGASRLRRFDAFIKDNAAAVAKAKRSELANATKKLADADLNLTIDQSLTEEVEHHSPEFCHALSRVEASIEKRRTWMLDCANKRSWEGEPPVIQEPGKGLEELITSLQDEAKALDLASNEETRKEIQLKFAELDAKTKCRKSRQLILDAISKMTLVAKLTSCTEDLKTAPITNKSKELAHQAVTQALSDALNSEFDALNLAHIKTKLKNSAKGGKTYHKLILDVPTECKLTEILSEGELRVMAIASFLAELSLANHSGGAIFDDPVSSLDHFRRSRVARRLADESKKRQVIIFTHDTVFLAELRGIVERENIGAQFYHLEWTTSDFSGYCNNGLPWHHQGLKERFDALEQEQRQLKREWIPMPNSQLCDRMRNAYSHFRSTIERAIETVFLNGVIQRFENYIPVKEMKGVIALTPDEIDELLRLFKVACDTTNAHDPATGANRPPPTPVEFEVHINELKTLVQGFKDRRAGKV